MVLVGVGVAGLTRSPLSKVKNPAVPAKLSVPSLAVQHKVGIFLAQVLFKI